MHPAWLMVNAAKAILKIIRSPPAWIEIVTHFTSGLTMDGNTRLEIIGWIIGGLSLTLPGPAHFSTAT